MTETIARYKLGFGKAPMPENKALNLAIAVFTPHVTRFNFGDVVLKFSFVAHFHFAYKSANFKTVA